MSDGPDFERLEVVMRGLTAIAVAQLQFSGAIAKRNDDKSIDVLLVEAGYSQTEVGRLLGKSQQAVSESVKRFSPKRGSK